MRAANIFPTGRVSLGGVAADRSRLAKQPVGLGLEGSHATPHAFLSGGKNGRGVDRYRDGVCYRALVRASLWSGFGVSISLGCGCRIGGIVIVRDSASKGRGLRFFFWHCSSINLRSSDFFKDFCMVFLLRVGFLLGVHPVCVSSV